MLPNTLLRICDSTLFSSVARGSLLCLAPLDSASMTSLVCLSPLRLRTLPRWMAQGVCLLMASPFIKLGLSPGCAIEKTLTRHTFTALKGTTETTEHFIREVNFPNKCVAKASRQVLLHWSPDGKSLQWHGNLSSHSESTPGCTTPCTWSKAGLDPIGVHGWAKISFGDRRHRLVAVDRP